MTESYNTTTRTLIERTVPGLHEAVIAVIRCRLRPGLRAVDLGTGSGAFAARLEEFGCQVTTCDVDAEAYNGRSELRLINLDDPNLAQQLGEGQFQIVSAIEVIEHLEAPIRFLQQIRAVLRPDGFAIVTTPNLDSLPAKAKFFFKGTLRMFDEWGDPTHISPIFWDLLVRQYLPRAHLTIAGHAVYPPDGFIVGRHAYRQMMSLIRPLLRGTRRAGDNHILILVPE